MDTIFVSDWKTPSFADFLAANPKFRNHSSREVVDPEVPVSVNPPVAPSDTGTDSAD